MPRSAPELYEELEKNRRNALLGMDLATLDALLSDSLMYCHSTGVIDSKVEFLSKVRFRRSMFHDFSAAADHVIRPAHNILIAAGPLLVDVEIASTLHEVRGRFLATWIQGEQDWQLTAFQGVGG